MNNHYTTALLTLEAKRASLIGRQSQAVYNNAFYNIGKSYNDSFKAQEKHIKDRKIFIPKNK